MHQKPFIGQQPASITSLNGFYSLNGGGNFSKLALTSDSQLRNLNTGSSTSFLINNNSASRSLSPAGSAQNTRTNQQAPVGVILIAPSNRKKPRPEAFVDKTNLSNEEPNSYTDAGSLNSPSNKNSNPLVVEQTSKLGIILQTKVLEEKVLTWNLFALVSKHSDSHLHGF